MRIVVADDSALIRDGLAELLPLHGFEIAATCSDVTALTDAIAAAKPNLVVLDIRMPPTFSTEGIEAAKAIRVAHPEIGVVVLSQYVEADYALELLRSSPARCGYLLKDRITDMQVLAEALRRVDQGGSYVDPELVDLLLRRRSATNGLEQLTSREREVLSLLAQGLTDRGISERLWLNAKTVETHVRHILAKLNLPIDTGHNRRVLAVLTYLRDAGVSDRCP